MGKNGDQARLPTVNKTMFENGNWQAFTTVINYIADLTVWGATSKEKGIDGKSTICFGFCLETEMALKDAT